MRKTPATLAAVSLVALALTGCAPGSASSDSDPTAFPESGRSVTLVVPYDAGGITDVFARMFGPELETALGTSVVIENMPGAGGQIGLTSMVGAAPDGYTIGFTNLPSTLAYLDPARGATYDSESFTLLGGIGVSPTALAVSTGSSYSSLAYLVEAAQASPGEITLATGGSGASDDYLAAVEFEEAAGVDFNLVSFEGGSAEKVTALMGGEIDAIMGSAGGMLSLVGSGEVQLLGSATLERSALLPEIPTFTESGWDVTISGTLNIAGPAGMPSEVAAALTAAIDEATATPAFIDDAAVAGFEVAFSTPEELAAEWAGYEAIVAPMFAE